MSPLFSPRIASYFFIAAGCVVLAASPCRAADSVRAQAAVNLTFDEEAGEAGDSAAAGSHKDAGTLVNGPERVESPFWNQQGRRALLLDGGRQQFVRVAESPDVDRPETVSLSFFFLNLQDPADAAARGIVAKRTDEKDRPSTNYGINFVARRDILQVYVNDGGGFRIATYGLRDAIGFRRRVFLTATFEIGDAPDPDADADEDDIRIRLFANGQPLKPTKVDRGAVVDHDAWLLEIKPDGLLNDVPLTLGSTNADIEHTSCLIDEFSLFPKALSPDEAARLFSEVAGPHASQLARDEAEQDVASPEPRIAGVSPRGLQAGETIRMTITGQNLDRQPRVELPIGNVRQTIVTESNAGRLIAELTVPADAPPGLYPLSVRTDAGLTAAAPVAVDRLPQRQVVGSSPDKPAQLPAAFSGTLSGAQQAHIYFSGRKGERIVADVEARRLGAGIDPVLEIKTAQGTPLLITWGQVHLRGDTRAEVTLPADGLYSVELHDLAYKAAGQSPFRLKIGDLKLIDTWFPLSAARGGEATLEPVGTAIPPGAKVTAQVDAVAARTAAAVPIPAEFGPTGPAPPLRASDAVEVVERASQQADQPLTVDATFAAAPSSVVAINGRISHPGERDVYVLDVTPGQKLNFALSTRSIDSPLDGEVTILTHPQGSVASVHENPGPGEVAFDYVIPDDAKQIRLAVRDLHGRGGPHFLYRLRITPAGRPDFGLKVLTPKLILPQDGSAVVELQLDRAGYAGPINLSVPGGESIALVPDQIPAGRGGKAFLTLSRNGNSGAGTTQRLSLIAESVGVDPAIRRAATISPGPGETVLPGFEHVLPVAIAPPIGLSIDLAELPPALFKGANTSIGIGLARRDSDSPSAIRLSLESTEAPRPADPRDARKGSKPTVRSLPGQSIPSGANAGALKVLVPFDVAESEIDFVLRADVVPHPFSQAVLGTVYSRPFRLALRSAASVELDAESLTLTAGKAGSVRGTVKRTAGFAGSIEVALAGLPNGYSTQKVTVPADAGEFELPIMVPEDAPPAKLPKVRMTVRATDGEVIVPDRMIALKIVAAPDPPSPPKKEQDEKTPGKPPGPN